MVLKETKEILVSDHTVLYEVITLHDFMTQYNHGQTRMG